MSIFSALASRAGGRLARFLNKETTDYAQFSVTPEDRLRMVLQPADVLLIEGKTRVSTAIKYLTQSTWSHSALYVGNAAPWDGAEESHSLIEVDLEHGVMTVPLSKYARFNTRICRAVGLQDEDRLRVVAFACAQIGHRYDMKNVFDLLRYLLPVPPVPARYRRHLLTMGSGDPTRAICSTLIAQSFQQIGYPILPRYVGVAGTGVDEHAVLGMRHYSQFVPRDFDVSPFFRVVKPTLQLGFDYRTVEWVPDRNPDGGAVV